VKRFSKIVVSLLFTGMFVACGVPAQQGPFDQSQSTWELMVQKKKTIHYKYTTGTSSWAGFSTTTTIEVKNGTVISRSFEAFEQKNGKFVKTNSYTETGKNVGSNAEGAKAKTLKELYKECQNDVLTKPTNKYTITFNTHKNGLIKQCTYRESNCVDDCSQGVSVSSIQFMP